MSRFFDQLMRGWYYPLMLVWAFRSYAFGEFGKLMVTMAIMTVVAAITEYEKHLLSKQVNILQGILVKVAVLYGQKGGQK